MYKAQFYGFPHALLGLIKLISIIYVPLVTFGTDYWMLLIWICALIISITPNLSISCKLFYLFIFFFFKCRTNIVEAHVQVQSLLKAEYTPEEIQGIINMPSIQELQAQLDNLL